MGPAWRGQGPQQSLLAFLSSLGLSIGPDANAETSFDDTQYTLRVPTEASGALAPGMGDSIQAAKAGILEIADVFVVNKADREALTRPSATCATCFRWLSATPTGGSRRS